MNGEQAKALAKLGAVVSEPNDWLDRRYDAIARCRSVGVSYGMIGEVLGVSRQAVQQFMRNQDKLREKGAA